MAYRGVPSDGPLGARRRCGAVGAAFDDAEPGGNIQSTVDAIRPGVQGASNLDEAIVDNVRRGPTTPPSFRSRARLGPDLGRERGPRLVPAIAAFADDSLSSPEARPPAIVRVRVASDVEWQALNPLRGDESPRAGTLWGDRNAPVPSGFLVEFADGFASPPHIHPVTYRGVVISGLVHNDRPEAEKSWLPPSSFWTQPAGEVHVTAAKGGENVAYIEIEKGPYLVHSAKAAFERTETPIRIDAGSMAWVDSSEWSASADGPRVAALPGNAPDDKTRRALAKLPSGFDGSVRSDGSTLHAVVIQGRLEHDVPGKTEIRTLDPGSYFGSEQEVAHRVSCEGRDGCVLYVGTAGTFDLVSAGPR